jgi:hypothetical protein
VEEEVAPAKEPTPAESETESESSEEEEELRLARQKAPKEQKPKVKDMKGPSPKKKKPIVQVVQFYVFNKHALPECEPLPVPQLYCPPDGSPTSDASKNLLKKAGIGLMRQQTMKTVSVR